MVGRSARFAPTRCLRWDQFASQRALGARVAAIAIAWTCWPRGHGSLELALLVLERPTAFGVSRVSMLCGFVFALTIDRGTRGGVAAWRPPVRSCAGARSRRGAALDRGGRTVLAPAPDNAWGRAAPAAWRGVGAPVRQRSMGHRP